MNAKELQGKRLSMTLKAYTHEGTKLDQIQMMKYSTSPDYMMDVFGDKSGEPQAIVFRESSPQEREAKLNSFMSRDDTGEWKNKEAPTFAALDMDRNGLNLAELKGKVVALNFWYIGCKPCIMEMPELNEMVEKYKGQDVVFIAVALDERNKLESFLQRMPFHYNIVPQARRIAQLYEVSGYPSHFLIDREGKVQFYSKGYNGALVSILDRRIEGLLEN